MTERITRAEALKLSEKLSAELGISTPGIRWTDRSRNGTYYVGEAVIAIGPACWRGALSVFIHEYAHHVNHALGVEMSDFTVRSHGPQFREALEMVAAMVLGDARRYTWHTEYRSIRSWATARGLEGS